MVSPKTLYMSQITCSTSVALLSRLGDLSDIDAWERFVHLYGPQIVNWCRMYGLQDADARDVAQDVLLQISKCIGRFQYDPSKTFRGWLRAVVHSAWCDWVERQRPYNRGSGDTDIGVRLTLVETGDDLVKKLTEEYERELSRIAMERVRSRIESQTWEAFRLLALEGVDGKEAAERLGMKIGTVFAAKSKVQRLVRKEIHVLDPGP